MITYLPGEQDEEELASNHSGQSDSEDSMKAESEAETPEDKENLSPNDTPDKASAERPKGRKRKRAMEQRLDRRAQDNAVSRRQRIRQYYNGATHGSASAVQLFAMAMQVRNI